MCVTFFYLDFYATSVSKIPYKLIFANNRDEMFNRATGRPKWSDNGILSTIDLVGGGTWLGMKNNGKIANLLNVPERHGDTKNNAPSRGELVTAALMNRDFKVEDVSKYNGFKLLTIDFSACSATLQSSAQKYNNTSFENGFHSIGNNVDPAHPFGKVENGKSIFIDIVNDQSTTYDLMIDSLFTRLLSNQEIFIDQPLRDHYGNKGDEHLNGIGKLFVNCGNVYGTRSQTIITIDCANNAKFVQREISVPHDDAKPNENFLEFEFDFKISDTLKI